MLRLLTIVIALLMLNEYNGVDSVPIDQRAIDSGLYIQIAEAVKDEQLQFTVTEPSGFAQKNATVRGSIPFSRGELPDSQAVSLSDEQGNRIALQTKATAVWPEQSAKFLCLDFQVDLKANEQRTFTLSYGSKHKIDAQSALKVIKKNKSIAVKTGQLTAVFQPGAALISQLSQKGKSIIDAPVTGRLLISKGSGDAPAIKKLLHIDAVSIVEQGPVQATLYLQGRYGEELSATLLEHQQVRKTPRYPLHIYVKMYANSARMEITWTMGYNG
ncbi:MAG: hypothetical protein HRU15_05715, partial [Planctomycetes bacterium]|nr:hypothetical protein [Planctomycetota bacterium]